MTDTEERAHGDPFRATFDLAAVGIAHIAPDGRWLRVNRKLCDIVGYEADELMGMTFQDITHPDDQAVELAYVRQALAGEIESYSMEKRYLRKDGGAVWMKPTVVLVRDPSGRPDYFISIIKDIAERKEAEEKLRASERLLSTFIEYAPAALAMFDRDMRYLYASHRWIADYRLDESDLRGRSHYDIFPEIPERWKEIHRRGLTGEVVRAESDHFTRDDGTVQWVRWEIRPWFRSTNEIGGIVIFTEDITERKRAEEALRAGEERLRNVIDNLFSFVGELSPEGIVTEANRTALEAVGMRPEDVLGKRFVDTPWWAGLPAEQERLRAALRDVAAGKPIRYDTNVRIADDRIICMDFAMMPMFGPDGKVTSIIPSAIDITERKAAEDALRRGAEQLRMAARSGNVGLWDWDLATGKVFFSSEWKRQIGYEDDEISNGFEEWRDRVHPDDLDPTLRQVQKFLDGRSAEARFEFRFRHKDGSYRWILAQAALYRDERGKPVRMMGSHIDMTERKRIEEQLVQAQKIEAIGNLTGGMAHDFNNYLTVVIGNLDLLKQRATADADVQRRADRALRGARHAAELVEHLLAFSRRHPVDPKLTDVRQRIVGVARMLGRLLREDISLKLEAAPDLWPALIDAAQFDSSIVNLANNARDAMPNGGRIAISARNVRIDDGDAGVNPDIGAGDYILIEVADAGIGMPADVVAKAFEPFFSTKDAGHGSGLGLSMVYGFVRQSNGHIEIDSAVGHGTTVRIYLPRASEEMMADAAADVAFALSVGGHETILVVEDNANVRETVVAQLESLGYRTIEAESADAALAILDRGDVRPDLVFTDIVMPGKIRGRELARLVAARQPGFKVLLTSGFQGDGEREGAPSDPDWPVLSKPYGKKDLARAIRAALDS